MGACECLSVPPPPPPPPHACASHGGRPAMRFRRDHSRPGGWTTYTWREYADRVRLFAKALIAHGLQRFDGVAIIGFNAPVRQLRMHICAARRVAHTLA